MWMASVYGTTNHEWGYTVVQPRIVAESWIRGRDPCGLLDINVRAAQGRAIFCSVIAHNKTPLRALGYFDTNGEALRFENSMIGEAEGANGGYAELPANLDLACAIRRAVQLTSTLSTGVDYARFDFLYDGNNLFAGEITAYPASGLSTATPEGVPGPDTTVSASWDLRRSWFLTTQQPALLSLYAHALRVVLS